MARGGCRRGLHRAVLVQAVAGASWDQLDTTAGGWAVCRHRPGTRQQQGGLSTTGRASVW